MTVPLSADPVVTEDVAVAIFFLPFFREGGVDSGYILVSMVEGALVEPVTLRVTGLRGEGSMVSGSSSSDATGEDGRRARGGRCFGPEDELKVASFLVLIGF